MHPFSLTEQQIEAVSGGNVEFVPGTFSAGMVTAEDGESGSCFPEMPFPEPGIPLEGLTF
ncbi:MULTISPECIES: hypothetical protein [unclassified Massilia]|uniref:hypothetical protein n=1 Tax=unclassified Massilia TaxID=2609279 RepID=UPI001B82F875|nr:MULTISPECIES: hypothetical protein [unclassified Massilia]MBQ5940122.1 hypothetical protein [Massilia sp. AB1]MBQ5963031.1 hypothetical protein [Massilia sp. ZL223]